MGNLMGVVVIALLIGVFLPLIFRAGYAGPVPTLVLIGMLTALAVLLPLAVRRSIRPRVQKLEFAG